MERWDPKAVVLTAGADRTWGAAKVGPLRAGAPGRWGVLVLERAIQPGLGGQGSVGDLCGASRERLPVAKPSSVLDQLGGWNSVCARGQCFYGALE